MRLYVYVKVPSRVLGDILRDWTCGNLFQQ